MRTDSRGGKPALPFTLQHAPLVKLGLLTPFLSIPRLHQNPQILLKAILFCSSAGQNRGRTQTKMRLNFCNPFWGKQGSLLALSSLPPQIFELRPRELSDVNTSEAHHGKSAVLAIALQQGAAQQARGAAHRHPQRQAAPLTAASRAASTRPAPQDPPVPKRPRSEDAGRAPSPLTAP